MCIKCIRMQRNISGENFLNSSEEGLTDPTVTWSLGRVHPSPLDLSLSSCFNSPYSLGQCKQQCLHATAQYIYTVSQKTSHMWLAITLTHVNGF